MTNDWKAEKFDSRRRSQTPSQGPGAVSPGVAEELLGGPTEVTSLVMADGVLFYATAGGWLYAFDVASGDAVWSQSAADLTHDHSRGGPWLCVVGEFLVVGGTSIAVYRTADGRITNQFGAPPTPDGDSGINTLSTHEWKPTAVDSNSIIATRQGVARLYSLDGTEHWEYSIDDGRFCHPSADSERVYLLQRQVVGAAPEPIVDGIVHALTLSGESVWDVDIHGHVDRFNDASAPVVGDTGVFIAQEASSGSPTGDGLTRIEKHTGEIDWQRDGEYHIALGPNVLYATDTYKDHILALDSETGDVNWSQDIDRHPDSPTVNATSTTVAGDRLYTYVGQQLCVVDTTSGDVIDTRTFSTFEPVRHIVGNHALFIGTADGYVVKLGGADAVPESPDKFCTVCGNNLEEYTDPKYCPQCGHSLVE